MMTVIASCLLITGCALALLAGVGVLRLHDVFGRIHAATKPSSLGLLLVCLGAGFMVQGLTATTQLVAVVVLQFFTAPVGAHLVGRAAYYSGLLGSRTVVDEGIKPASDTPRDETD
jgi:multicomponent Na+:H+ antiporter subunit G